MHLALLQEYVNDVKDNYVRDQQIKSISLATYLADLIIFLQIFLLIASPRWYSHWRILLNSSLSRCSIKKNCSGTASFFIRFRI
jgi:hypothetical protein